MEDERWTKSRQSPALAVGGGTPPCSAVFTPVSAMDLGGEADEPIIMAYLPSRGIPLLGNAGSLTIT